MEVRNTKKQKQTMGLQSGEKDSGSNYHHSLRPKKRETTTMVHALGIVRSFRDIPPAHYCLKINSISFMLNNKIENFESGVFEVGGYRWKLSLYPNGNKKRNVTNHISLYLGIVDTKNFQPGWEVNVSFKLFAFDQIRDRYLTVQEGDVQRFHWMKTQWGFDKFLPLETFNDATNGYLLDDSCLFGTEIFVLKNNCKGECLSLIKDPVNKSYSWDIEKISAIDKGSKISSPDFVIGGHKWKLVFYANGEGSSEGKSVSQKKSLADIEILTSERRVYVEYKLRMKNQAHGIWFEYGAKQKQWFYASHPSWGFSNFMALSDFNNPSKGFLKNDAVVVEVQITHMLASKDI